ncbi:hypothetical protein ACQPYH_28730 [Kribbella sp. CA-245084]|uniref:hypothetical protein n=1 Tax=Kribbella sp. CA-245084 TaxID=3239940 RepID=UPI003D911508
MTNSSSSHQVMVVYHQFFLAPYGHTPILDSAQPGRLLVADPAGPAAIVRCGCAIGPVNVTIDVTTSNLPDLAAAAADWELGEEMTMQVRKDLYLVPLVPEGPIIKVYSPSVPGPHLIRAVARGRATHYDSVVEEPTEDYLITISPTTAPRPRQQVGDDTV